MLRRSRTLNDEQEFFEILQKKRQLFEGTKSQRSQESELPNWKTGNKPQKPIEFGIVYKPKKPPDGNAPADKPTVRRAYRPHLRGNLVRSNTLPNATVQEENSTDQRGHAPGAVLVMTDPPAFYKQRYNLSQQPGEPSGQPQGQLQGQIQGQPHPPPPPKSKKPLSQRQGYTRSKTAPVAATAPIATRPSSAHNVGYNGYPAETSGQIAYGGPQGQRSYTPGSYDQSGGAPWVRSYTPGSYDQSGSAPWGRSYTPGANDQSANSNYNYPRVFNPSGFHGNVQQGQGQPYVSSVHQNINQPVPKKAGHVISAHKPRKVKAYGGRAKSMDSALFEEAMAKKKEAEYAQQNQPREAEYSGATTVLENQIRQLQQQEQDKIEAYKQLWRQELASGSVSRYMPGAGSYVTSHYVAPPPPAYQQQVQTFYETKKKKVPTATLR